MIFRLYNNCIHLFPLGIYEDMFIQRKSCFPGVSRMYKSSCIPNSREINVLFHYSYILFSNWKWNLKTFSYVPFEKKYNNTKFQLWIVTIRSKLLYILSYVGTAENSTQLSHSNAYIVWANKSVEHWLNENVDFNLVYLSPGTLNANEHKQDC